MKARTLIVDDAPFMREHLIALLEADGFEIVGQVGDGQEAIDVYQTLAPDLVIMDLLLPTCSGIDAVREICAFDGDARVLVTSSRGQEPLVTEALEAGARDWVVKSDGADRLLRTVKKVLSN